MTVDKNGHSLFNSIQLEMSDARSIIVDFCMFLKCLPYTCILRLMRLVTMSPEKCLKPLVLGKQACLASVKPFRDSYYNHVSILLEKQ